LKNWREKILQILAAAEKKGGYRGVAAMEPDVLVLDEPTSGLDASGSQVRWNFLTN